MINLKPLLKGMAATQFTDGVSTFTSCFKTATGELLKRSVGVSLDEVGLDEAGID